MDLTLIQNAHREGELARSSLESALRAVSHARQHGISVEWRVVLDVPDLETERLVTEFSEEIDAVLTVDYADLGLARNAGVREARGNWIAFLDSDDLFCEDWLTAAIRLARLQNERVILHPELDQLFGREQKLIRRRNSTDSRFLPLNLLAFNEWSALCLAPRSVFLNGHWYQPIDLAHGFGFEDWHWNCETLAAGIPHLTVPRTRHYLRQKAHGSLGQHSQRESAVIRPTRLFASDCLSEVSMRETHSRQWFRLKEWTTRKKTAKRLSLQEPVSEHPQGNISTVQVPRAFFTQYYPRLLARCDWQQRPLLIISECSDPSIQRGTEWLLHQQPELFCLSLDGRSPRRWHRQFSQAAFEDLERLTPGCQPSEREQLLLRLLLQHSPAELLMPLGVTARSFMACLTRHGQQQPPSATLPRGLGVSQEFG